MLKNMRNAMAEIPLTKNENKKTVTQYIKKLATIQNKIRLRLDNKLTIPHIEFRERVMNIQLAKQTLSQSISTTLNYLEAKISLFNGADGTTKFCQILNNGFDILNCRQIYTEKYETYKKPII